MMDAHNAHFASYAVMFYFWGVLRLAGRPREVQVSNDWKFNAESRPPLDSSGHPLVCGYETKFTKFKKKTQGRPGTKRTNWHRLQFLHQTRRMFRVFTFSKERAAMAVFRSRSLELGPAGWVGTEDAKVRRWANSSAIPYK